MGHDLATRLMRAGVLDGVRVIVAGAGSGLMADSAQACERLGARVALLPLDMGSSEEEIEAAVADALAAGGGADALVLDGAGLFVQAGPSGASALAASLDTAWKVTRAAANAAFVGPAQPGRIIFISPAPGAGEHAEAAIAALENLARTLSVEWARHRVTAVAIAPEDGASDDAVAALVAYLLSPAGEYFSGCVLPLGALSAPSA